TGFRQKSSSVPPGNLNTITGAASPRLRPGCGAWREILKFLPIFGHPPRSRPTRRRRDTQHLERDCLAWRSDEAAFSRMSSRDLLKQSGISRLAIVTVRLLTIRRPPQRVTDQSPGCSVPLTRLGPRWRSGTPKANERSLSGSKG